MKTLFIHRSVGNNLINDSNFYELLSSSDFEGSFADYDNNTGVLRNQTGTNTEMFAKAGDEDFPTETFTEPDDLAEVVAFMLSRPEKLWINEVRVEK